MKLKEVIEKFSTEKEFIDAVEVELLKLIKDNPDFRYQEIEKTKDWTLDQFLNTEEYISAPGCRYNSGPSDYPGKCTGCIFGQALQNLGWSDNVELNRILTIEDLFDIYAQFKVPSSWKTVQELQDNGCPWGLLNKVIE